MAQQTSVQGIERIHPVSGAYKGPPRYCQVVKYNGVAYIAGQTATDLIRGSTYEAQIQQALAHLEHELTAAGTSKRNLLSVRVYLKDIIAGAAIFNDMWLRWLGQEGAANLPTRTTIQADLIHPDLLVEVDAVAAVPPAGHMAPAGMAAYVPAAAPPAVMPVYPRPPDNGRWWRPSTWARAVADFATNGYVLTFGFLAAVALMRMQPVLKAQQQRQQRRYY